MGNKLKKLIRNAFQRDPSAQIAEIKGEECVSFDVFDTLLKRSVASPEDVFSYMEKKIRGQGKPELDNFAELRVNAEREARKATPQREVSLRDIYSHIACDDGIRSELMEFEMRVEEEVSVPNLRMKMIYDVCVSREAEIYFISDMYLPEAFIRKLLQKNGYTKGKLYVSSESGRTKRSGELFRYIRERERIDVKRWIHIGDSLRADYIAPKRMGIRSILIERNPKINRYVDRKTLKRNPDYAALNHFIDVHLDRFENPYERIGYAIFGPLLYGFSVWLEQNIPQDASIVFMARDGAMLQRAFEVISNRPTTYMYISRKAANLAHLGYVQDIEEASQKRYTTIANIPTTKELAKSYGLSDSEISEIFGGKGYDENQLISDDRVERQIVEAIWPVVSKRCVEQHNLLSDYIKQLGLTEKCALVDVGWAGTTQTLLERSGFFIDDRPILWEGYYIGLQTRTIGASHSLENRNGYLYGGENTNGFQNRIKRCLRYTNAFFELFFLSTEGTTKYFERMADGTVRPVKSTMNHSENISKQIQSLQNTAIKFVADFNRCPARDLFNINSEIAIGNYIAFANKQTQTSLKLFQDFKFYNGNEGVSLIGEHNVGYYLIHLKQFKIDFINNTDKAWFLQKLLKVPLPYFLIVEGMRKLYTLKNMSR